MEQKSLIQDAGEAVLESVKVELSSAHIIRLTQRTTGVDRRLPGGYEHFEDSKQF